VEFFNNLFRKKPDNRTKLEKFLDARTASELDKLLLTLKESTKIPLAQAMAMLLFARSFTKHLQEFSQEMPEPFRTSWVFQHDRIFAEVVAFYYFVVMREFLAKECEEDEDWDVDEAKPEKPTDPYFDTLNNSLHVANKIFTQESEITIHPTYIINRTYGFSSISQRKGESVVDALSSFIMDAWNPDPKGRMVLDISAPTVPIMSLITAMPIDAIEQSCKDLYEYYIKQQPA
jgi:hypothetical protein